MFLLLLTAVSTHAQSNGSTVIWSEDFTSKFECPTIGKNATYTYSGTVMMSRQKSTDCICPELQLETGGIFTAKIALYGASGDFTLSFKYNKNYGTDRMPTVTINDTKLSPESTNSGTYAFSIPENTESITIAFSNETENDVYLDDIVLSGSANCRPTKTSPELSFTNTETTVTYGETYHLPALNNPHNLPVYYWNTDDSIASVDKDGNVKINSIGKTVVSAIYHGDENYSYQEASYTLNVERKKPEGEIFYESFDKNLSEGGNDGNFGNPAGNVTVELDQPDLVYKNNNLKSAYKCIIIGPTSSESGSYSIKSLSGLNSKCKLTFRIAGMTNKKASCYVEVNKKQYDVNIEKNGQWYYKEVNLTGASASSIIYIIGHYVYLDDVSIISGDLLPIDVNISSAGYSTLYYSDKALVVPEGMEAYTMNVADDMVKKSHSYEAGSTIPKGTAVVLKANEGKYSMRLSSENGIDDSKNNMLKGSDTEATTTGGDIYYKLASPDGVSGFYWGAEGGGAFRNGAHKAYLAVKKSQNAQHRAIRSFAFNSEGEATKINAIEQGSQDYPLYNLQGQRVDKNYRGIVIRQGRKFIMK